MAVQAVKAPKVASAPKVAKVASARKAGKARKVVLSRAPDELCGRCRKVIGPRAKTYVVAGRTVTCAACYKKHHAVRVLDVMCQACGKLLGKKAKANLIGGKIIACAACYKKHCARALPNEVCFPCGRVIGPRARAHVIGGGMVACAACYRKHEAELAREAKEEAVVGPTVGGAIVVWKPGPTKGGGAKSAAAPARGSGSRFGRKRIVPGVRPLAA